MKVAIVMPPATAQVASDALASWPTLTAAAGALRRDGRVAPVVHCRHVRDASGLEFDGVEYRFHLSDDDLVESVAADQPDVVHVHGLGWSRLIRRLASRAPGVPLVLQHHGELPFRGRAKWGHRAVRRHVDGYLFTGASTGQAEPWIRGGVIAASARCHEVLEAASLLPQARSAPVELEGEPAILWVGRLNPGKDPIAAVEAFALASSAMPGAHLHLLASDRDLEREVRDRVAGVSEVAGRIHLHDPVPHGQMGEWYAAAPVFFSTSHHEGSGYALIEALTSGCVPVVTAIPPHRAIVGELGWLFAPGDVEAAARGLEACAGTPREPIAALARTSLSWGRVTEQLLDAYASVVTADWTPRLKRKTR